MRNHLLDLFKLIFIIIVAFHHTEWTTMQHGYLPVEFFFIASGYFIYKSYEKRICSTGAFMLRRCQRLAPAYLITLSGYIIWFILLPNFFGGGEFSGSLSINIVRDLFCIQSVGLYELFVYETIRFNPPDWYISSFLYGGMIVYLILKSGKKAFILLPATVIITYITYFVVLKTGLNEEWGYRGFMYMPLWRGIAGMSLGALAGIVMSDDCFRRAYSRHIILNNTLAVLSCLGITYILFARENYNFAAIVLFVILFSNLIHDKGLANYAKGRYWAYVPDISLEILLLHKLLIVVTVKVAEIIGILDIEYLKYSLYVIILITCSVTFKFTIRSLEAKLRYAGNIIPLFTK